jgi:predicted N-acetyltransferase YhbS
MVMSYQITKANTSTENINAYSRLLSNVFSKTHKFTVDFLNWQYSLNPQGTMVGSDAFFEGELIAHHATIPVSYTIFGQQAKGLLAINNVTHPDHQGKGLFSKLGNATFEEAKSLNYDFVITVTNSNSTYGYLNKFGFRHIAPLDVKIGCGKIITSKQRSSIFSNWDFDTLNWRLKNPSAHYFRDNQAIMSKTDVFGMFAQIKNGEEEFPLDLNLNQGRAILNTWIGLSKDKKVGGCFINMPDKMKPSPLNLLFKDLQGQIPVFDKDQICFELADFDAF